MLGHVLAGVRMIDAAARGGSASPTTCCLPLLNAVASHHGPIEGRRLETAEAVALYHANSLDARLGEALSGPPPSGPTYRARCLIASSSSPAPRPGSARPPPVARSRAATGSCSRRAASRRSTRCAGELGADNALAVACDVTEWDQVEALAAAALDRFGRIDVVFANAGFGATRGFLNETPEHGARWC